jgi:hypothetical protein
MSKEVKDLIKVQERYERLILRQGSLLKELATLSMKLAEKKKSYEAIKVREFVKTYGIDYKK